MDLRDFGSLDRGWFGGGAALNFIRIGPVEAEIWAKISEKMRFWPNFESEYLGLDSTNRKTDFRFGISVEKCIG